jgi:hypothetical protein
MLELLKFLLEKLDFVKFAESARKRRNRKTAAQLHLILVQSYEIVELYEVILDELRAALETHQRTDEYHRFDLNPSRIASLLARQSSNLSVMEELIINMLDELRILDNDIAEAYRKIFPGKWSILFEAEALLANGRLPLAETAPDTFPATENGEYRTLWFTSEPPREDREQIENYLYPGRDETNRVFDVNVHDGDAFFHELERYFRTENPLGRLKKLKELTERYRIILLETFTLEDILSDISKVRKHQSWAR